MLAVKLVSYVFVVAAMCAVSSGFAARGAADAGVFTTTAAAPATGLGSSNAGAREYGIFMGLQYYGPPVTSEVYDRVAAAAASVPVYVSVCADHNDTSGGAEHR